MLTLHPVQPAELAPPVPFTPPVPLVPPVPNRPPVAPPVAWKPPVPVAPPLFVAPPVALPPPVPSDPPDPSDPGGPPPHARTTDPITEITRARRTTVSAVGKGPSDGASVSRLRQGSQSPRSPPTQKVLWMPAGEHRRGEPADGRENRRRSAGIRTSCSTRTAGCRRPPACSSRRSSQPADRTFRPSRNRSRSRSR